MHYVLLGRRKQPYEQAIKMINDRKVFYQTKTDGEQHETGLDIDQIKPEYDKGSGGKLAPQKWGVKYPKVVKGVWIYNRRGRNRKKQMRSQYPEIPWGSWLLQMKSLQWGENL